MDLAAPYNETDTLGEALLTPTRIYVKPVLELLKKFQINGMSHITGGGFIENIPRMLPEHCDAEVDVGSWPIPPLFQLLQEKGKISHEDMFSTFNMGIGLVLAIKNEHAIEAIHFLETIGEKAYLIGRIGRGSKGIHLGGVTL
jgi:phosphoribosylformylglycinamidine cyclo-ligase